MIGIAVAFRNDARHALLFRLKACFIYLTAYALMTLGAFGVIIMLSTPERPVETVDDLAGLGQTHPVTAFGLTICLFSLAGIPPLAGFWGKFELFASAFGEMTGEDGNLYWWLAVIGVLNSAVGAYYYLRIVVGMYLRAPAADAIQVRFSGPRAVAVGTCVLLTFLLGIPPFQTPVVRMTREAARSALEREEPIPASEGGGGRSGRSLTSSSSRPTNHPGDEHRVAIAVLRPDLQHAGRFRASERVRKRIGLKRWVGFQKPPHGCDCLGFRKGADGIDERSARFHSGGGGLQQPALQVGEARDGIRVGRPACVRIATPNAERRTRRHPPAHHHNSWPCRPHNDRCRPRASL